MVVISPIVAGFGLAALVCVAITALFKIILFVTGKESHFRFAAYILMGLSVCFLGGFAVVGYIEAGLSLHLVIMVLGLAGLHGLALDVLDLT